MRRRRLGKRTNAMLFGLAAVQAQVAAASALTGHSLEEAIALLDSEHGLRVFYSSELVRPWMQVQREPDAASGAEMLAAILAPHGLTTRTGPQSSLLVVRDDAASPLEAGGSGARPTEGAARSAAPRPPRPSMEEIVVAASRYELRRSVGAAATHFGSRDLEYLPDLGEDALRSVARLPGTASTGFTARSHIRGGALDETLVRIDGLRLYDPFHLRDFQGVFSMIDPRIVQSMDIYTGGFPADFGDRLSGVVDVATIVPAEPLHHELGVSFFNSSLLSSGRFADERAAWLVSLRRSNLDLLYDRFSDLSERPRYADAFGKLAYRFNDRLTVTVHALRSEDNIVLADDLDREELAEAHHSDRYLWVGIDQALGDRIAGTTTLAHATLDGRRSGTTEKEGISHGFLSDVRTFTIDSLTSDWSWRLTDAWSLRFGGSARRASGAYAYRDEVEFDLLFDLPGAPAATSRSRVVDIEPGGHWYGLHAGLRYRIGPKATAELGMRFDDRSLPAESEATLDPRLGFRYRVTERLALRVGIGRVHQSQGVEELSVGDGETRFAAPRRAQHALLGLEYDFEAGLRLRADLYDKRMSALPVRYENLVNSQILLPELKPDRVRLAPVSARATGLELMLDSAPGPRQWWIGYSWSEAKDRDAVSSTPRSWDQTHALTAGAIWDWPRWSVSAALSYRSGWPTTSVAFADDDEIPRVTTPAGRNDARLGAYRSLDLRIARKIELPRSTLALTLELANAFGRDNPCCSEYELDDNGRLERNALGYLPTIPSLGLLWTF